MNGRRTLAAKLTHLFEMVQRPEGGKYTDQEVADWLTEHWDEFAELDDDRQRRGASSTYIGYLRRGIRRQASASIIAGIGKFFGVDPSYLLPGNDREDSIHDQLSMLGEVRQIGPTSFHNRGSATNNAARLKIIQALLADVSTEIKSLEEEEKPE
ncbi:hypothetical protein ACFXPA_05595 [Amycolatopsis sp. NPDC059090]|uniref:hypothetical protein n=1 Tax=unclassified Amycolatopsis TaxID=2618356 RepID=UPI00366AF7AC